MHAKCVVGAFLLLIGCRTRLLEMLENAIGREQFDGHVKGRAEASAAVASSRVPPLT